MRREEALEAFNGEVTKFEGTRNLQWKFNLSVWTMLILAIYYKNELKLYYDVLVLLIPLCIVSVHIWFNYRIQYSLECSKKLRKNIKDLLDANTHKGTNVIFSLKVRMSWEDLRSNSFFLSWILLQASITLVLSFIFLFREV